MNCEKGFITLHLLNERDKGKSGSIDNLKEKGMHSAVLSRQIDANKVESH